MRLGSKSAISRQSTRSLDYLIGSHEQIVRYGQAKRLCCLEIDDHLEFGGLHDRQIEGLFALENSPDIDAHLVPRVGYSAAIADQPASGDIFSPCIDRGQAVARGEFSNPVVSDREERPVADEEPVRMRIDRRGECGIDLDIGARRYRQEPQLEGGG